MKKITKKGVAGLVAIAASVTIVSALAIGTVGYLSTQVNNASKNEISNIMDTLTIVAEDNRNSELDLVNPPESVPEIPIENGNEYIMLYDQSTSFVLGEENIDILNNGEIIASLPSSEFEKEDNNLTISGLGAPYDGTYVFYGDGYVELNGTIVAKSKNKWLTIPEGSYLIVHKNDVWFSMDGNIPLEIVFDQQTLYNALTLINENIDENGKINEWYSYTFSKFDGETITLKNAYDILALQHFQEKIRYDGSGYCYEYWGGMAYDIIFDNTMITNVKWNTKVNGIISLNFSKITNYGAKSLSLNDSLDGLILSMKEEEKYYFDNEEVNVFIVEDMPFAYEKGMTYREWIHSKYRCYTLETWWSAGETRYLAFPEEILDMPCGDYAPGYSLPVKFMSGVKDKYGYQEILYCDGTITNATITDGLENSYLNNNDNHTFIGFWYGFNEKIGPTFESYDVYNYYIRNNLINTTDNFYIRPAYKENSNIEKIDISDYIIDKNGSLKLDTDSLKKDFNITGSINPDYITKDGESIILLSTNYSNTVYSKLLNGHQRGLAFVYDGVWYEGWI